MTKWFVTDMDGTFLNDKREIAPNSKEIVERLESLGSRLIIATGRVDLAVRTYYNNMNMSDVTISCNGAFIRNQKTGEIIYESAFSTQELETIYEKTKEMNDGTIDFHAYSKNYIYCERISPSLSKIIQAEKNEDDRFKTPMNIDKDILKNIYQSGDLIYKVLLTSENHDLLRKVHSEINKIFELEGVFSATDYFDLTPKGTSKGEAIKRVAEHYNLDIKDSVVFGDNFNDVEMLKVAGTSVCPSNAKKDIQEICDEIIGNNNEFSVMKYIEDYVNSLEN